MQTFLPYPDFAETARCLDRQRLGKQRVEVLQILRCHALVTRAWANHPAVRMWWYYSSRLAEYGEAICQEWIRRGYQDNCLQRIRDFGECAYAAGSKGEWAASPPWLGDPAFHASHRAALLAKNPEWYGRFGWTEEPRIQYVWPV